MFGELLGIDTRDYVKMTVGADVIVGDFETGHSDEERGKLSAVHFVRFAVNVPLPMAVMVSDPFIASWLSAVPR